ncbi:transcriptional regulator, partial [Salmonella enterica subsp. salamae]|nr:transcriptional regulator [Salmonella enterica subsp. salamae]
ANANKDFLKYKTIPFYLIIRNNYEIYNLTS